MFWTISVHGWHREIPECQRRKYLYGHDGRAVEGRDSIRFCHLESVTLSSAKNVVALNQARAGSRYKTARTGFLEVL
jgi:hypothetical protein